MNLHLTNDIHRLDNIINKSIQSTKNKFINYLDTYNSYIFFTILDEDHKFIYKYINNTISGDFQDYLVYGNYDEFKKFCDKNFNGNYKLMIKYLLNDDIISDYISTINIKYNNLLKELVHLKYQKASLDYYPMKSHIDVFRNNHRCFCDSKKKIGVCVVKTIKSLTLHIIFKNSKYICKYSKDLETYVFEKGYLAKVPKNWYKYQQTKEILNNKPNSILQNKEYNKYFSKFFE
jgi:hypothetical protein